MSGPPRVVARIGKAHGLRGEVTVQLHTDVPEERLAVGAHLATEATAGSGVPRRLTVRSTRVHRGIWLVAFDEVPDRTGAESLRGTRLVLNGSGDDDDLGVPDHDDADHDDWHDDGHDDDHDDGWYEDELVGLEVVDVAGQRVGVVAGLELGAAQDLVVVELTDGHRALVPFVAALVPEVDVAGGRVVIDPPPGLLDLGREG